MHTLARDPVHCARRLGPWPARRREAVRPAALRGIRSAMAALLLLYGAPSAALAEITRSIAYQGFLSDKTTGLPVDTPQDIDFALCGSESGACGSPLFTDARCDVGVANGRYEVEIGSKVAGGIPDGVFRDNAAVWLEVRIAPDNVCDSTGYEAFSPRIRMQASPYAFKALHSSTAAFVLAKDGSVGAPSISFASDPDNGLFLPAANQIGIGTSGAEAIRVRGDGNVGIGTTNPAGKLYVLDGSLANDAESILANFQGGSDATLGSIDLQVYSYPSATAADRYVRISAGDNAGQRNLALNPAGGNVGIGTTGPGAKLEVAGQVKITGGVPGAGKVLTSDGAGLASWQTSGSQACPSDMAAVGSWCVDKYEASVWGSATCTGTQYGINGAGNDNYPAACNDNGSGCKDLIYACSLGPNTTRPSTWITWFQANIACANAGKELLPNAVWQMAATGTPDPGTTNAICNVASLGTPANTGALASCVSDFGALDMAGNVWEWVGDWVAEPGWNGVMSTWSGSGTGSDGYWHGGRQDSLEPARGSDGSNMTWNGAANSHDPGAVMRGGGWGAGATAGVFAFYADDAPSSWLGTVGLRCGRRR